MKNTTEFIIINDTTNTGLAPVTRTVVSLHDQISMMNEQYMRMMLIMSAILFIYVCYNYYLRDSNEWAYKHAGAFDAGCLVASLFTLIISIVYFTGWM